MALDTYPYSGGLTTCEALWMGVPVLTIPGETFASRHSLSHLTNAGCSEFIFQSEADLIQNTLDFIGHPEKLAQIRQSLREKMWRSPLCDVQQFCRDFEQFMEQIYTSIK